MSGKLTPLTLQELTGFLLEVPAKGTFFNIPRELFFFPDLSDPFRIRRYDRMLANPVGVAAGPHTQLAGNIIAAWLCGARYIELKTVQTLDHLEVAKPCIDMADEGYNCEWSQELTLEESFREYLNAWIAIHILHKELRFSSGIDTLFNMSVGYNMSGILQPNVQNFLARMKDCRPEMDEALENIRVLYPGIRKLNIPSQISNHITLSTMHGCPPEEIERIGRYLLEEQHLHTTIKLNPTLLGANRLRTILNEKLGFPTEVPDLAFEHDLKYPDAVRILSSLQQTATEQGLYFGVKLTNTLESLNNRQVFPETEKMMYMSGRALHPVSIELAGKLQHDFQGKLDISFSAGADCFNLPEIIASGLKPVTVCSDLLKPGGYGRLKQYLGILSEEVNKAECADLDHFILHKAGMQQKSVEEAALFNLNRYTARVSENPEYHRESFQGEEIKTSRPLGWFDCIHAPCTDTCPTNQEIPEYMHHVACGNFSDAYTTIFRTNPFPTVTGMICDHPCQQKCTRINYDDPLKIREIKAFASGFPVSVTTPDFSIGQKAAIIGAGPAGLSCAWFLRQAGCEVDIFDEKPFPGGMVSAAIPSFRLTNENIQVDLSRILSSGVRYHSDYHIDYLRFNSLMEKYDAVFYAGGAQSSVNLDIEGTDCEGVVDPLQLLFQTKSGNFTFGGKHVVIIGGGNTAMDAARTALRLTGNGGSVTVVYRRTIREMPADKGEIKALIAEGARIKEMAKPLKIIRNGMKVSGLECIRTVPGKKDQKGRAVPAAIPGSEFIIPCDTIIPAIGQKTVFDFLPGTKINPLPESYRTNIPKLFIGGDAMRGASTAINAIGDGRKAALQILESFKTGKAENSFSGQQVNDEQIRQLQVAKATRVFSGFDAETFEAPPRGFDLLHRSLTAGQAVKEASRCLRCDLICNVCVSVCPNLANFGYRITPVSYNLQKAVRNDKGEIIFEEDEPFIVDQPFQVMNIRDLCNECGNCVTFCPSSGRPFADKPGLCLNVTTLNEEGRGFFFSRLPGRDMLIYKEQEHIRTLYQDENYYHYETDQVKAVIRKNDFGLSMVSFLTPCVKEFRFGFAAEMSIVLQGALQLVHL